MRLNLNNFLCILFICVFPFQAQAKKNFANPAQKLYFIENKGQVKDQFSAPRNDISYVMQGQGITIFIGDGQLHYQFANIDFCSQGSATQDYMAQKKSGSAKIVTPDIETYRMDVELLGANKHAEVIAEDKQAYYENYFLPGCPTNGVQAHTFKKVTYKNILPDIDWVICIKGEKLEQEFVIKQGGDASKIKLKYNGQTSLNINENDGSITATTPMGIIKEYAPVCYTEVGGKVASSFKLHNNVLSYDVNGYDGALVIDPVLEWGTYYGSDTSNTYFYDIVHDDSAHIYGCGFTFSTAVGTIATTGAFQTTYGGDEDAFIVKFDTSGNRIWGTYFGGYKIEWAAAITYDHHGNIYITGVSSTDTGIATPGTDEPTYVPSEWDGILAKFTAGGMREWCTYVGGTNGPFWDIEPASVICDTFGHVYVSGQTDNLTNISTPGCWKYIKTDTLNIYDCFLIQYDTSGHKIWGTYYGGTGADLTGASCTDGFYVFLAGYTWCDTGIASSGSYQPAIDGSNGNAFLAKFDTGGHRLWGTYYGASGGESVGGVMINNGYLYLLGSTESDSNIASAGCFQPVRGGGKDAFLAKFDPDFGTRIWGTYYGGPGDETTLYSRMIADDSGNVYICGYTNSTTGIATPCAWQTTYGGDPDDAFLARYNSNGVQDWASYYGGSGEDGATALAFDGTALYASGVTQSTNNISTPGSFLSTGGGSVDYENGFLSKFTYLYSPNYNILGLTNVCIGDSLTLSDAATGGIWSSSNTAIEKIGSMTAKVTGIAAGTATLTYSLPVSASLPHGCNVIVPDTVKNCTAGVPVITGTTKVEIFPNPASSSVTITSSENIANITITNLSGEIMYSHSNNTSPVQIDVAGLPAGIYMVKVNGSAGLTMTKKFVKE